MIFHDFPVQSGDLTAKIGPVAAVGIPGALGTQWCMDSKVLVQGMHYDSVVGLL